MCDTYFLLPFNLEYKTFPGDGVFNLLLRFTSFQLLPQKKK